jgi:hypothetical protein
MKLNPVQADPSLRKRIIGYIQQTRDDNARFFASEMVKSFRRAQKESKRSIKKTGFVGLSNTDSIEKCGRLKARLNAKLAEIYASNLDNNQKMQLARTVMMEIMKVDQKAGEIRRRERAQKEEADKNKTDTAAARRRRKMDLEKRTIGIRNDFLHSAKDGGFDPNDATTGAPAAPAVSFSVDGASGTVSDAGEVMSDAN